MRSQATRNQDRTAVQYLGPLPTFLVGVLLAMCVGLVGGGDYEQAVADAKLNQQMLAEGSWCSEQHPCTESHFELPPQGQPIQQYAQQ